MTITEILERAHQRTGRKLESKGIDERGIVIGCLQDLCEEKRWPWRRKWASFASVVGTSEYDLTDTAIAADVANDIEEIICITQYDTNQDLDPITSAKEMATARRLTTRGAPDSYFLKPGTEGTVRLVNIPDAARTYDVVYWAIPNPDSDDSDNEIPLLPSKYHRVLLQYVTAMFWSLLPGEGIAGPNASQAYQMYRMQLELMKSKGRFSTAEQRHFKSNEDAVRSD